MKESTRTRLDEWRRKGAGLSGQRALPLRLRLGAADPRPQLAPSSTKGEGSGSQVPLHLGAQGPPAGRDEATFRDPHAPPPHVLDLVPLCCLLLALIAFLKSW